MTTFLRRAAAVAVAALALTAVPTAARAETVVTPGSFTGYGFDTCQAPSQAEMDAWLETSRYWAVGVYLSGDVRACPDQPNLTPEWFAEQSDAGWRVLPLTVGPQAACTSHDYSQTIDQSRHEDYAAARAQGRREAASAVDAAHDVEIARRSTLWYDLEHFDVANDDCRRSALAFLSGWTEQLHDSHYRSGVYSSASSGIAALDNADKVSPGSYTMPDQIWWADWHTTAKGRIDPAWVRSDSWSGDRVHQYRGGTTERHGGVALHVDRNYVDIGGGSVAPRAPGHCGVPVDYLTYRTLRPGSRAAQVPAAQCFLRKRHYYRGPVNGRVTKKTERAVIRLQKAHGIGATGILNRRTWTALLSEGGTPLQKYGAAADATRRIQRALNAALHARLEVTGVFDDATSTAVKRYQRARDLPATGVVDARTWTHLRSGRH